MDEREYIIYEGMQHGGHGGVMRTPDLECKN